jgi:hypothetical protein
MQGSRRMAQGKYIFCDYARDWISLIIILDIALRSSSMCSYSSLLIYPVSAVYLIYGYQLKVADSSEKISLLRQGLLTQ